MLTTLLLVPTPNARQNGSVSRSSMCYYSSSNAEHCPVQHAPHTPGGPAATGVQLDG